MFYGGHLYFASTRYCTFPDVDFARRGFSGANKKQAVTICPFGLFFPPRLSDYFDLPSPKLCDIIYVTLSSSLISNAPRKNNINSCLYFAAKIFFLKRKTTNSKKLNLTDNQRSDFGIKIPTIPTKSQYRYRDRNFRC